jgi:hypothetical protein
MEKLTFLELAKMVLAQEKRPLAPSEIWKIAVSKGYDQQLGSQGKTPAQTQYSIVFLDQRDNPNMTFIKYETRPVRYYLKSLAKHSNLLNWRKKPLPNPQFRRSTITRKFNFTIF